jgi:ABC-type glycerol-3-phosphate transport system permease component
VVTLSSLTGFVLAKCRFFGRRPLMLLMLLTILLPPQVLLPGSYDLIYHLGWINSYWAIVVPGSVSVFGAFLFRQAMKAVPDELLASARLDGCGDLRLWWDISLPIVRPMIGAFTLLSFLSAWNSFLWPQIVLQDESKYTLPLALNNLSGQAMFQEHFGVLMAATLLGILPVVILFFALQKDFIGSLTSGAVKG